MTVLPRSGCLELIVELSIPPIFNQMHFQYSPNLITVNQTLSGDKVDKCQRLFFPGCVIITPTLYYETMFQREMDLELNTITASLKGKIGFDMKPMQGGS